jgi:polyvinyl alcohol dehydrogenase (cytochrome)
MLGMVALSSACNSGNEERSTSPGEATASSAGSRRDWPVYGHDTANTRANLAETRVDRESVRDLEPRWRKRGLVGVTGTPTVSGGVAYFGDWEGAIWAVEAGSGQELWKADIGGMIVGAPAVVRDAVFASSGSSLFRLDRVTGEQEWMARTDDHPAAQINASPVVVDGLVLQGTASFENVIAKPAYTFRGSIGAWDAETGEQRWKFFTTPNDSTAGAGAGVWGTPAVDRRRGLLFVGTGQSLSEPTAPLTDSLLAIDYRTGELRWSQQFTYPDVFSAGNPTGKDADVGASPNLWTVAGRDFVGAGDKGGTFHALDRETGKVVWEKQLTPGSVFGGQIGSAALVDGKLIASSNVGDPDTNAPTDVTKVFAMDPATGRLQWTSEELAGKIFAPVGAVPGVAFVGTDRGLMVAFDTETGEELWSFEAPAKTACGPSIVDGRVLWGYGFVLFQGAGDGGLISFTVDT